MKDINTSSASFEDIINPENNNIYVDKTSFIYNLVKRRGVYYFLSRPRRFGKSLTISTMKTIFEGKKELFKGLAIYNENYDWQSYPLIRIDFSTFYFENASVLKEKLKNKILEFADLYSISIPERYSFAESLDLLITKLKREKGKDVVVLIDEYDSIISRNTKHPEIKEILEILRAFYDILKAQCENIRFCFITGCTKFAKLGIFSSMNNPEDISSYEAFSTMFGYSQEELEQYFADYINLGAKELAISREEYLGKLKDNYDGFLFYPKAKRVYNPVSINSFFHAGGVDFRNFWSNIANTSLIFDVAERTNFDITKDLNNPISADFISSIDILQMTEENVDSEIFLSLMYQFGYLTIKSSLNDGNYFYLDFPNKEVRSSFCDGLLKFYLGKEHSKNFKLSSAVKNFELSLCFESQHFERGRN